MENDHTPWVICTKPTLTFGMGIGMMRLMLMGCEFSNGRVGAAVYRTRA